MRMSTNAIAIAGEFAVLSQLALRGIDANLTLGTTKSIDILASNPNTGRMFKLEVKTAYNNRPTNSKLFGHTLAWVMSKKNEGIVDQSLSYCFVNIARETTHFTFHLVPSPVVDRYVRESHRRWLGHSGADQRPHVDRTIRQFRLGLNEGGYPIDTPFGKEHEDNWGLLLQSRWTRRS